jgi:hypothetical protein
MRSCQPHHFPVLSRECNGFLLYPGRTSWALALVTSGFSHSTTPSLAHHVPTIPASLCASDMPSIVLFQGISFYWSLAFPPSGGTYLFLNLYIAFTSLQSELLSNVTFSETPNTSSIRSLLSLSPYPNEVVLKIHTHFSVSPPH